MKNIPNISWSLKPFSELTKEELYECLHLRCKVFVEEQKDIYVDVDFADYNAIHLMGYVDGKMVAYSRLFAKGTKFATEGSFGRVLVLSEYRQYGLGKQLVAKAIEELKNTGNSPINIAAQLYLQKFYEGFGFQAIGEPYEEYEIPHVDMLLNA